jgi:predicted O-linked N-acetylglucosamine transferase (SPINDLY family)
LADLPLNARTLFQQGLASHQAGHIVQAQDFYRQALVLEPQYFDALHLLGVIEIQNGAFAEAAVLINKAIVIDPQNRAYAPAYSNRGIALRGLGNNQAALDSFNKALDLNAGQADVHFNCGNTLRDLGRIEEAVESYDQVLRLVPNYAEAYQRRGICLNDLNLSQAAAASFAQAIKSNPNDAQAFNGLGIALANLSQTEKAAQNFTKAIALDPNYKAAYNNFGNAMLALNRPELALASYDKAVELGAGNADTYNNRATALNALKRPQEAVANFGKVLELKPGYQFVRGLRQHARMYCCDWKDFDAWLMDLVVRVRAGEVVTPSWPLLALIDVPAMHRAAAEIWAKVKCPANVELGPLLAHPKHKKIRLGYYSADYHNHATANLTAELFERHDRDKFELLAFSFGPVQADSMQTRLKAAFDDFLEVSMHSDQDIAALSRQLEIDIAIDLKGYTEGSRTRIFAHRAAPVQVNYLGYPGTMAASYMDYVIGDAIVIPEQEYQNYAEKVVTLPGSYQVNDSKRKIADKNFTRADLGLPKTGFVFCCFNNNFKILPECFDMWMRILGRVEGSVLWLFEDNPVASANLRAAARRRGIDEARLIFAPRISPADHLARQRLADLFLDTLPYNAHTTASDALWVGLPVLTCTGQAFAGRVAASLLTAVNLPELITTTMPDYESLAITLAKNPARLAVLRQKLADNRFTASLFDAGLFTKHIEDAYTRMFKRRHAGLPPAHMKIPDTRA